MSSFPFRRTISAVAFGLIYIVTVFSFSVEEANELGNWTWATNAAALILAGVLSDYLRVRKPFMILGGIGGSMFNLSTFNLLLEVSPQERRPTYLATFNTAVFS